MLNEQKPIQKFEDLPEEMRDVEFLRSKFRQSIALTTVFGGSSGIGTYQIYKTQIDVNPAPEMRQSDQAIAAGTLALTALFIIGTCASFKLRKLIRQGEEIERRKNQPPGSEP